MPGMIVVDVSTTHADLEQWAWYCAACGEVYCGQCCLPKWQALKAQEGLSGRQLAAKLEADPGAYFFEAPTCPVDQSEVVSERPEHMPGWLQRRRMRQQVHAAS